MKIKLEDKTIKKIEELTLTDYKIVDNMVEAETCVSIIEDLLLEYEDLLEEYNNYVARMEDRL